MIVPAFNEKPTLATLMDRVLAKSIDGVDIEVIIVESNSTDGTREEVLRYQTHPRVRVILQDRPRGKGYAVRTGLAACTGDVVLFQDADLEYDVDDYDDLIAPLLRLPPELRDRLAPRRRRGAAGRFASSTIRRRWRRSSTSDTSSSSRCSTSCTGSA